MPNFVTAFLRAGGVSFWEELAAWYENSVFGELAAYFKETYFSPRFGAYNNFDVTEQAASMIVTIIVALIFGCIIASFITVFYRRIVGNFVKTLIKKEAFEAENALTLYEIGGFRSVFLRSQLRRGVFLRKVVFCCEEQAFLTAAKEGSENAKGKDAVYKIDFTKDRFYIPRELKDRAEIRFENRGSGWLTVVLTVILAPVFGGLICRYLPNILQLVDSMITFFAP